MSDVFGDTTAVIGTGGQQLILSYGDGGWADLAGKELVPGRMERAAFLRFGTQKGNPTVELLVRTDSGLLVHCNTTWALFRGASQLFEHWERYRT